MTPDEFMETHCRTCVIQSCPKDADALSICDKHIRQLEEILRQHTDFGRLVKTVSEMGKNRCVFCHPDRLIKGLGEGIEEGIMYINGSGFGDYSELDVNYCPVCGRDLKIPE